MTEENKPIQISHSGKKLTLNLDIPAMRRLRRYDEPIDIMKIIDYEDPSKGLIAQLQSNPSLAVDIVFEATHADPNRLDDPVKFGQGLSGDALHEYIDAALEAVIRFTPDRKVRTALLAVKKKATQAQDALGDRMIASINDGTMDKALEDATQEIQSQARVAPSQVFKPKAEKPSKSKTGSGKHAQEPGSSTSSGGAVSKDSHSEISTK